MERDPAAITFGLLLRGRRHGAKLTQEALAERSGLHPTYVSLLERGLRQPSLTTLLRISRALGVTAAEVVGEVERSLPSPET